MADIYINLDHEEYKELELQMRAFKETVHGEGTEYYHKSISLKIADVRWEFHGPAVRARRTTGSLKDFEASKQ